MRSPRSMAAREREGMSFRADGAAPLACTTHSPTVVRTATDQTALLIIRSLLTQEPSVKTR
eukprot:8549730-Pyramimonas_sp.AAC.1